MLEQSDSLYLAVKLGKPGGFPGFPIPTPLPLSSALAQFGMMQRNLISFYLQCMQSCIQKLDTSKTVKVRILYFTSVGSIGQGPLNIWTEHSNCQIHSRGDSKPLKASLIPNIFLIFFYEIIFYLTTIGAAWYFWKGICSSKALKPVTLSGNATFTKV